MTKKFIKTMIIIIIVLTIIFVLFKILNVQSIVLKKIYPTNYKEYVEKYSKQNNVDEYMIYAIIKAESNFKPNVKSKSNAIGLMQLLEDTAIEMSNTVSKQEITEEGLYDPETNIKLGTSYYSYLLKHYKGNNILALTAYNAGMGNVDNWIKKGVIKSDGTDIENIPYKETNNYVRKILRDYKFYVKLYEDTNWHNSTIMVKFKHRFFYFIRNSDKDFYRQSSDFAKSLSTLKWR